MLAAMELMPMSYDCFNHAIQLKSQALTVASQLITQRYTTAHFLTAVSKMASSMVHATLLFKLMMRSSVRLLPTLSHTK
jgi:hypothetical protein